MKTTLNVNHKNAQLLIFGLEIDLELTEEQCIKLENIVNALHKLGFSAQKKIAILAATLSKI